MIKVVFTSYWFVMMLWISTAATAQIVVDSIHIITKVEDSYPSWSPDGKKIAFQSNRNSRFSNIYLMNADGSGITQLTNHEFEAETPVWSPDGQWIIYSLYMDSEYENSEVMMIGADGKNLKRLTKLPSRDDHQKFSADGKKIIFNSQRDDEGQLELKNYEIYEMDISGKNTKRLTNYFEWDTYPSYSPDGKKILWRRILADTTAPRGYNSEIFLMDRSGDNVRNLTNHPSFDGYPEWSPDGDKIVFASSRNGETTDHLQLFVMNVEGQDVQQITWNKKEEEDVRPDWSPDGKRIVFNRVNKDGTRIYIMDIHPSAKEVQFNLVESSVVTADRAASRGVAWGDYDGDGFAELVVANTMNNSEFVYKNNGKGGFEHITEGDLVTSAGWTEGVNWIDYDNDGDLDVFYTTQFGKPNELYRNDGSGSFTSVDAGSLTTDSTNSPSACWCDYDLDGDLDVYVVQRDGQDDVLYNNRGDGKFTTIPKSKIPYRGGDGRACAWGDIDGDRYPELYVGNFLDKTKTESVKSHNFFFKNNRDGSFSEISNSETTTDLNLTYGVSFVDYDQDGDLDLFITNIALSDKNFLYQNDGKGNFTRMVNTISNAPNRPSKGHAWGDYDNDGNLDVFIANGTEGTTKEEIMNYLFLSNGKGDFLRVQNSPLVKKPNISAGTAWADYDRDGDLDLFVANWGGNVESNDFYRNDLYPSNWIAFNLKGTTSNSFGIGARVRINVEKDGKSIWLTQWLLPQTGYGSQNEPIVHFGLGIITEVKKVEVLWPSGIKTSIDVPITNRYYTLPESGEFIRKYD